MYNRKNGQMVSGFSAGWYQLVSQVPVGTWNIYPLWHGKWLTCNDSHGIFVDKGDAEMRLSVVMLISIILDDIIIDAPPTGFIVI